MKFFHSFHFHLFIQMLSCRHHARIEKKYLKFGYGINFKYKGMLSHSFDRFYVVTKFELPKVEDLKLTTVQSDSNCSYLIVKNNTQSSYYPKLLAYCQKIVPYLEFYKKQINYYNCVDT